MAELGFGSEITSGIVIQSNNGMKTAVQVFLDLLHRGRHAGQDQIECIIALFGLDADSGARLKPGAGPFAAGRAPRTMQLQHILFAQMLRTLQHGLADGIAAPDLLLLVISKRQDSQRKDLVDFSAIEKIAGTLGCNLWVVIKDDRSRQQMARIRSEERRVGK